MSNILSPCRSDRSLVILLRLLSAVSGAIVLLIFIFLLKEALPLFQTIPPARFFSDASWHPTEGHFNLLPMLLGSVLITLGALVLAAPLAVFSGIFSLYYAPQKVADFFQAVIRLLAGIPSVVYGLWGLLVLVPLIRKIQPPGASLFTGLLILALMILPTIALNAHAALARVPFNLIQGAAALGLSRWQIVKSVVLPLALPGIWTGTILGAGRAIGETMAVLMVSGNVVKIPSSLFDPVRTLTANIALEMSYAMNDHRAALFVSALILMGTVFALVVATESLDGKRAYE